MTGGPVVRLAHGAFDIGGSLSYFLPHGEAHHACPKGFGCSDLQVHPLYDPLYLSRPACL